MEGLQVQAIDASGKVRVVPHTEPADPDMQLLLDMMKPMLAQAMGNLAEDFLFFPLILLFVLQQVFLYLRLTTRAIDFFRRMRSASFALSCTAVQKLKQQGSR